ncbi:hypothetical protein [Methylogaea oryzae]|uniref:Uncharacterized protein n=1 Tax=Methylogaea oryzae TaxID=1295382 RepID=A0A8D4VKU0_9GAMM|nr:hypothetical protein [Methylogaea oryzae]BBL69968.1 hypothetical protein MoryE10_05740 [Methylogaea oryzae]
MKSNGHNILLLSAAVAALVVALPGCSTFRVDPQRLDRHFGESANAVKHAQIADPQAASNPVAEAPNSLNGERGERVMKDYVTGAAQGNQRIGMPTITIGNIGGGSGGSSGTSGGGSGGGN